VSRALVIACLLAVAAGDAVAEETHGAEQRVAYLERALAALRATPPQALAQAANYAQVMSRSSCASEVLRLKVECLMTASRTFCRKKGGDAQRCAADMDVVVAKLLGDAQLIPAERRYQIMMHTKDYRGELARESRRLAGALAVEFRLKMGEAKSDAQLARNVDQYCLASSDENAMPWQACASSLLWFVVTESGAAAGAGSDSR
jgi:hypothetical protein